jgi:hypothetical protein
MRAASDLGSADAFLLSRAASEARDRQAHSVDSGALARRFCERLGRSVGVVSCRQVRWLGAGVRLAWLRRWTHGQPARGTSTPTVRSRASSAAARSCS